MFDWRAFPFTKMNAINLDWIMKTFQDLLQKTDSVDAAVEEAQAAAEAAEQAAASITGAVLYDQAQTLTGPEQAQARTNIGAADANDIVFDAVQYNTVQSLSTAEKNQARANIDAASTSDAAGAVKYTAQVLDATQQAQARTNIGAADAGTIITDVVQYDTVQTLTNTQKQQARDNIGAADAGAVVSGAVLYDQAQTLDATEQAQARSNIGAIDSSAISALAGIVSGTDSGWTYFKIGTKVVAFKRYTFSGVDCNTSADGQYASAIIDTGEEYPAFVDASTVIMGSSLASGSQSGGIRLQRAYCWGGVGDHINVQFSRSVSGTGLSINAMIYIIGDWVDTP